MLLPLYPCWKKSLGTLWIGGWVDRRNGLDCVEIWKPFRSRVRFRIHERNFINILILPVALGPGIYSVSKRNKHNTNEYVSWGVERDWCVRLTMSTASVSRLSRQCGILNTTSLCRPPRPVTEIALLYCFRSHYMSCIGSVEALDGLHSWSGSSSHLLLQWTYSSFLIGAFFSLNILR
jgi:hypothetical protein